MGFLIKFVTSLTRSIAVFLQLKRMPQNLNALIRYKQIDLCLRNPYLKATIRVLQRKCSEQLAEHRGVYKQVSERTIREDIRVMRSDALGFEAPIVVMDGVYAYSDRDYSIFNRTVNDLDLLTTITQLLVKERKHLKNPELLELLEKLKEMTGVEEVLKGTRSVFMDLEAGYTLSKGEMYAMPVKSPAQTKGSVLLRWLDVFEWI